LIHATDKIKLERAAHQKQGIIGVIRESQTLGPIGNIDLAFGERC
jgi:hypothetical protein